MKSIRTFCQNPFQKTAFGQTIFVAVPFGQIVFEEDFGYSNKILLNQRLLYFRTKSFRTNPSTETHHQLPTQSQFFEEQNGK
jgi:hypothetical protein